MQIFEVHSNESACRKSRRLGLEQVDDVVDITVVQLFVMSDEAFIGKEKENKKKKKEEGEKRKGDGNAGGKSSGVGAKRRKKMRGGIDRFASKGDNEDNANLWYKHNFDVRGRRRQSRKGKRDEKYDKERKEEEGEGEERGGEPMLPIMQKKKKQRKRRTYPCTPNTSIG